MKQQNLFSELSSINIGIENATIKECLVADFIYATQITDEMYYQSALNFCKNDQFKEFNQLAEGNCIRIIYSFKTILNKRKKWFLENSWGINVEEITLEIDKFEEDFKEFIKDKEEEINTINTDLIAPDLTIRCEDFEDSEQGICNYNLYIIGLSEPFLETNSPFATLYKSFLKQYDYLKYKIHAAATINHEEYIAELRTYSKSDPNQFYLFPDVLKATIQYSRYSGIPKKDRTQTEHMIKDIYNWYIQEKFKDTIETLNYDSVPQINNYKHIATCSENLEGIALYNFLCNSSKKYTYFYFHLVLLINNQVKEKIEKYGVGKLLYNGYIKWCVKNQITPNIKVLEEQLFEDQLTSNKQYHFPKKRFINNPNNVKREELNKTFLKNLLEGMIDKKIIAPDTKEEHFFFVFGYGEDTLKDFKAIEILKPETNYTRESGKRTIVYLLKELMGYSDDEIRPTIGKNKHLIINFCFKSSPLFKSSDFKDNFTSEASEIMKASELQKMKRIFETALNDTRNNPLI